MKYTDGAPPGKEWPYLTNADWFAFASTKSSFVILDGDGGRNRGTTRYPTLLISSLFYGPGIRTPSFEPVRLGSGCGPARRFVLDLEGLSRVES